MRRVVLLVPALAFAMGTSAAEATVPEAWAVREAAATAEAGRLVAGLAFPSGTVPSGSEPAGDAGRLAIPPGTPELPWLVELHGWWVIPGPPLAALDYIHERSPELAHVEGWSPFKNETGAELEFARLTEGTGVIGERWLRFIAVALANGSTGVRVDTQVIWQLPRNPIPGGTRLLQVEVKSARRGNPRPLVYNIRSASRIARVVSALNTLPAARPSLMVRPCRAPFGTVRLALYRKPSEPPQAVVVDWIGGCGGAEVVIRGQPRQPELESDNLLATLERILGRKLPLFR